MSGADIIKKLKEVESTFSDYEFEINRQWFSGGNQILAEVIKALEANQRKQPDPRKR